MPQRLCVCSLGKCVIVAARRKRTALAHAASLVFNAAVITGAKVGTSVGTSVGAAEGAAVGANDGRFVGR